MCGSVALPLEELCIKVCGIITGTWLDTSCAAVIGPRSYGLCWWSQRVREAGGRVVPVHHPVKDSPLRRSFVEQRTHIVAAAAAAAAAAATATAGSPGPDPASARAGKAVPSEPSSKKHRGAATTWMKTRLHPSSLIVVHLPSCRSVQALHGFTYCPCWLFPRMHRTLWLEVWSFSFLPPKS